MKHALMAQIEVSLPAKADEMVSAITARIVGKALWQGQENRVSRGKSERGNPLISVEYRFDKKIDQTDLATFLGKQRALLPFVEAKITTHDCYHDEGGRGCDNWQEI